MKPVINNGISTTCPQLVSRISAINSSESLLTDDIERKMLKQLVCAGDNDTSSFSVCKSAIIECEAENEHNKFLLNYEALTLPETNIAPENRPSQKETSIPTIPFQVLC